MTDEVIEYKSPMYSINSRSRKKLLNLRRDVPSVSDMRLCGKNFIHLVTSSANDITCIWSAKNSDTNVQMIHFEWKFDWSKIKNRRVDELNDYIIVKAKENHYPPTTTFSVKLTEDNRVFAGNMMTNSFNNNFSYEYSLIPHYTTETEKSSYDEMFLPSEQNDTILVVKGKKLHVSKAFLSYHSDYFRALFSSNYKESQMDEIPIKDVSFQDFALLLSSFYPNPVFPNDNTVDKLLEMSRRFMVLSVINIIEYHLLNNSKIDDKKMLWLADEYGMPTLLEKCICGLTIEKMKILAKSQEYGMLSDSTKAKVLDHFFAYRPIPTRAKAIPVSDTWDF